MVFDTTDEALGVQRDAWRRLGPEGRVRVAIELSEAAQRIALAGLRSRHPALTDDELMRLFVARTHGTGLDTFHG